MSKHELHLPSGEQRSSHDWDTTAIALALNALIERTDDFNHGSGLRMLVGSESNLEPSSSTVIEVFPDHGVARIQTGDARLELHRLDEPPLIRPDGVIFGLDRPNGTMVAGVMPNGRVTFVFQPEQEGSSPAAEASIDKPEAPVTSAKPKEARERQPRLTLIGRLGTAPRFRTTSRNRVIAEFPLGVHDGETTTWHKILAFDQKAEKLRGIASKGQEAEVIGYVHEREVKTRHGANKRVVEIYATAIRLR